MRKLHIIINGPGGVGKDSLIESITKYKWRSISSIDPYKEVAKQLGWDGSKDDISRKFLSDLKSLSIEYNDFPAKYIYEECVNFVENDDKYEILFIHIREPEEIKKVVELTGAITLLVTSGNREIHNGVYGNKSDDSVCDYNYDYAFVNESDLRTEGRNFNKLIDRIISDSSINITTLGELSLI